jgi:hypothetical protein
LHVEHPDVRLPFAGAQSLDGEGDRPPVLASDQVASAAFAVPTAAAGTMRWKAPPSRETVKIERRSPASSLP